jgi:predicted O-methyltransferase YrrM
VLAGGFQRGLELGTSYGYSGLWLGSAFAHNGGALTTLDHSPAKTDLAQAAFAATGLGATINVLVGDAADSIARLTGPFDFAFLDPDKENLPRYFELLWPRLGPRATLVTDNVLSHPAQVGPFAEMLRRHPQLCSTLVGIGSGLELTVKL